MVLGQEVDLRRIVAVVELQLAFGGGPLVAGQHSVHFERALLSAAAVLAARSFAASGRLRFGLASAV